MRWLNQILETVLVCTKEGFSPLTCEILSAASSETMCSLSDISLCFDAFCFLEG